MPLNLDEYVNKILPWDFPVQFQGRSYPTAAPTIGDLIALGTLNPKDPKSLLAMKEAIERLVPGAPPALLTLPPELLGLIASKIIEYFNEYSRKNSEALGLRAPGATRV